MVATTMKTASAESAAASAALFVISIIMRVAHVAQVKFLRKDTVDNDRHREREADQR